MNVQIISYTNNPAMTCEIAASQCYDSTPTEDFKIIKQCYKSGHTSVLEHAQFTFLIEGVSRALLSQLTRHRHASFSVQSQRYVDMNNFEYVTPPIMTDCDGTLDIFADSMFKVENDYYDLMREGVPKEDARYVLPNACCTQLVMTMNMRSLINFMNQRLCNRAQWEIRELANKMKKLIVEVEPVFKDMLVPSCEKYKDLYFCTESNSCGRHMTLKELRNDVIIS